MAYIALILWLITALGGLYMLAVWLIENDVTKQGTAASRLPVPVIFGHLLLAVSGLAVWVAYLLLNRVILAWTALYLLLAIALLGATMFARWIPVYRGGAETSPPSAQAGGPLEYTDRAAPQSTVTGSSMAVDRTVTVDGAAATASSVQTPAPVRQVPAESNFPVLIVVGHGMLAASTVVFVLLTALGIGTN